jgi:hypothetical protein
VDDEVREVVVRGRLGVDDDEACTAADGDVGQTCSEVPTARKTSQSAAAAEHCPTTCSSSICPK